MPFLLRLFLSLLCALIVACIVNVRLGQSLNFFTVVGSAVPALVSPTPLPLLSYPESFRSINLRDSALRGEKVDFNSSKGSGEGLAWGIAQILSFYLPFFLIPGKKKIAESASEAPKPQP